jgi:L-iditol 2-dehydrogenase
MTDRRNKMLAAVFQGPGQMEVTEVETPDIGADEVLVKVGANTICGTDVRIFRGEKTRGIHPPTILGHEIAGHVYQVGKRVRGFEVERRYSPLRWWIIRTSHPRA